MRQFHIFFAALAFYLVVAPAFITAAGAAEKSSAERIVVCLISLEHADAEELTAVLEPLLSPAGRIVPYRPTNTLIIRDRASIVEQLSIAIKGSPCNPISNPPEVEPGNAKNESRLDRSLYVKSQGHPIIQLRKQRPRFRPLF